MEEVFKGTKGKWVKEIKYGKKNPSIVVVIEKPNNHRQVIYQSFLSEDNCTIDSCCMVEEHANAKLISKAPEMLDLLLELKEYHLGDRIKDKLINLLEEIL